MGNAPGSGVMSIPPVSVCHQVSTMGHLPWPITSWYQSHTSGLMGSPTVPINPEVWLWYHDVIGQGRCPIVDTWWQTETGGILITPLPGAVSYTPGSATLPYFGLEPA